MSRSLPDEIDVAVIGAGAAGIAAGRRLAEAGVATVVLEARDRVGGRAWTVLDRAPHPLDMGCAWLHSAGRNPWTAIAEAAGFAIDRSDPAWGTQAGGTLFAPGEIEAYRADLDGFFARLAEAAAAPGPDRPASDLVDPDARWTPLIEAINSYINGASLAETSIHDFDAYEDTEENWRLPAGYGTLVAAHAAGLPIVTGCPVARVDHSGPRIRLETPRGTVTCRAAIVTVPTPVLASGQIAFVPALPDHQAAAAGLPLGVADKVFLSILEPDALPAGHVFGAKDRAGTGSYHLRRFGWPMVEAYFGGPFARDLERAGPDAAAAFALDELAGLFGADIRKVLKPVAVTAWAQDVHAGGSYSIALPGHAGDRARLAAPAAGGRLFFAGEATHTSAYSTAHGAYLSGRRAAEEALAAIGRQNGRPSGDGA